MLISQPLPFIRSFVDNLDAAIKEHSHGLGGLSTIQRKWLGFCLMAIMVTNSICWARFERASLGGYSQAGLSWMLRHAKLPWEWMLQFSVRIVLRHLGITRGALVIDDTDKRRSKVTSRIAKVHKLKDKTSGGFIQGQSLVFLLLVTDKVTFPVGFAFYAPDPVRTAWAKQDKKLKKKGVPKSKRPQEPARQSGYPTKAELALQLLKQFKSFHPMIAVKCILADALYGTGAFMDGTSTIFNGAQVISQLRSNQKVRFCNRTMTVSEYFTSYPGVKQQVCLRGGKHVTVIINSARLWVHAHGKKRFVIALKYEGETDYRYLVASDLTWRTQDIVQAFTLRWLVEVFFEDWKAHEGWGALTMQRGEEGSSRSLTLSLLVDNCLLLHPDQLAQMKHCQPAFTVGSLTNRIKVDSVLTVIREVLAAEDPAQQMQKLSDTLARYFKLQPSEKHMVGRDLGQLEPSPSLKYKAAA